jgi:hypothetical protein
MVWEKPQPPTVTIPRISQTPLLVRRPIRFRTICARLTKGNSVNLTGRTTIVGKRDGWGHVLKRRSREMFPSRALRPREDGPSPNRWASTPKLSPAVPDRQASHPSYSNLAFLFVGISRGFSTLRTLRMTEEIKARVLAPGRSEGARRPR